MEKKRERCVEEDDAQKVDTNESLPKASKAEPENRLETEGNGKAINDDKFENRSESSQVSIMTRSKEERLDHSTNDVPASPAENEKIEVLWDIKQESEDSENVLIENVVRKIWKRST